MAAFVFVVSRFSVPRPADCPVCYFFSFEELRWPLLPRSASSALCSSSRHPEQVIDSLVAVPPDFLTVVYLH